MRVLIVHVNVDFMNPTVRLWPLLFAHSSALRFFGPGYVGEDTLRAGLKRFLEREGPFDLLVASDLICAMPLLPPGPGGLERVFRISHVLKWDARGAFERGPRLFEDFASATGPKVVTTFEFDCYNMWQSQCEQFEQLDACYVGWGSQFVRRTADLPHLGEEVFGRHANDRWHDFATRHDRRIVSLPAFVHEDEFSWVPLAARPNEWAVPGDGYRARRIARKALVASGVRSKGKGLGYAQFALRKLGFNPFASPFLKVAFNHFFREAIESSRYCYTCGSALGYPLRKFFEVPALGTVLVCLPCSGFEALGFRDGVNAVASAPEGVVRAYDELRREPERAQAIADAGRDLVWRRHTVRARARQLLPCLEAIVAGRFAGSCWDAGRFVLRERTEAGGALDVTVDG